MSDNNDVSNPNNSFTPRLISGLLLTAIAALSIPILFSNNSTATSKKVIGFALIIIFLYGLIILGFSPFKRKRIYFVWYLINTIILFYSLFTVSDIDRRLFTGPIDKFVSNLFDSTVTKSILNTDSIKNAANPSLRENKDSKDSVVTNRYGIETKLPPIIDVTKLNNSEGSKPNPIPLQNLRDKPLHLSSLEKMHGFFTIEDIESILNSKDEKINFYSEGPSELDILCTVLSNEKSITIILKSGKKIHANI